MLNINLYSSKSPEYHKKLLPQAPHVLFSGSPSTKESRDKARALVTEMKALLDEIEETDKETRKRLIDPGKDLNDALRNKLSEETLLSRIGTADKAIKVFKPTRTSLSQERTDTFELSRPQLGVEAKSGKRKLDINEHLNLAFIPLVLDKRKPAIRAVKEKYTAWIQAGGSRQVFLEAAGKAVKLEQVAQWEKFVTEALREN
jgi:hypothetical protein